MPVRGVKYILFFSLILVNLISNKVFGQCSEDFEGIPANNSSYLTRSWSNACGTWEATNARTDQTITTRAICINGGGHVLSPSVSGGIADLSFKYQEKFTGSSTITVYVNGVSKGTFTFTSTVQTASITGINVSGNIQIEIVNNGASGNRVAIDDLSWTGLACTPPTVTSFAPSSGPVGTRVAITGSGFTGATDVTFDGISASSYTVVSNTEITAVVPTGATTGKVGVELSCFGNSAGDFTVVEESGTCGSGGLTELIISEYIEGSSSNKYIEIYNGTGADVNLGNYSLRLYSNGAAAPSTTTALTGTLTNGSVIVYKNASATAYGGTSTSLAAVNFNGDDAVELYNTNTSSIVDIFGNIGCDPGSAWTITNTTVEKTLVRKPTVCAGITTDNTTSCPFPTLDNEWTQYNQDVVTNLGSHTSSCGGSSPATISVHPTDKTDICNGSSTTFSVAATGTTLTYQWKVNTGGTWDAVAAGYTGGTTNTLTVTDVTGKSGYQYYCEVTESGTCGVASNAARLTAKSCGSTITTQPEDDTVCANENVFFFVEATGTPTLSYQWRVLTPGAALWQNVGTNNDTLFLSNVTSSMRGNQYFVEITDGGSSCTVSDAAVLMVNALPETPAIVDTAMNCDKTVLTRGTPAAGVTWYWQDIVVNGKDNSGVANSAGSSLSTYEVSTEDVYYLRAQNTTSLCWSQFSDSIEIDIRYTPTATLTATAGCGNGIVRVSSSQSGDQTFDLRDNSGASFDPAVSTDENAAFHDFGSLPNGTYRAYVTKDGCTSALSASTVLTNNAIPEVPSMSDNGVCGNNVTVTLTATANGAGTTSMEFSVDGIPPVDATDVSTPYTYDVLNVLQATPRNIYARASNGTCQSEWVTAVASALVAPGAPTAIGGITTPRCQEDITSTYTTSSTNVSTFTWSISGGGSVENTDFTFIGTKSTASEQVEWDSAFSGTVTISVIANNSCGSTAATTANMVIQPSTKITVQPDSVASCETGTVSFTLTATGTGTLTYQWQKKNGGTWNNLSNVGDISGATSNSLTIANIGISDADNYRCIVHSDCGTDITSEEVTLSVLKLPNPSSIKSLLNIK